MALGALTTASGAVATSAAIAGTADVSSSMTAIVEENLELKAGAAFNDDGTVRDAYQDQYVSYPSHDSFFQDGSDPLADISRDEVPVATVSPRDTTVNDEVEMQVALSIENSTDTFLFEDFLRITNNGGDQKTSPSDTIVTIPHMAQTGSTARMWLSGGVSRMNFPTTTYSIFISSEHMIRPTAAIYCCRRTRHQIMAVVRMITRLDPELSLLAIQSKSTYRSI